MKLISVTRKSNRRRGLSAASPHHGADHCASATLSFLTVNRVSTFHHLDSDLILFFPLSFPFFSQILPALLLRSPSYAAIFCVRSSRLLAH